ncbi:MULTISPECIES: bifunctional pyr operon transcriptional regulator/uracil phosphoribosyltransferase PyrR [unclassified Thioalkalivibrio]|jgi:pyrimidine operon attenuation protein/uracil phosphoribosyltransferase|uniref:bifunctional pyr operon transcriptional regulator/uracil phosphoribosyltransferase PyrR n=1 Tax=unclassified Thioalkalivibrio TaxID=2621013 RepID=UPI0001959429|nr:MULTISPECIES: bifunctional pyr operon transcriptional regulator/uracil phosphoribosyltransferase PyrR [unclassified Thioalkalivibrio]ADC72898.1 Uracil phosphoribosyltransferase [Thioalkalivibrio sp. K90mix]
MKTPDVPTLLDRMADQTRQYLARHDIDNPMVVGIHSGGVWIAEHLRERLGVERPLGKLDISFYRDDFSRIGMHPQVRPSELPEDLDGVHVLLVDDVLYTGRTIRAALNELFDYGRPASVTLAVLVERDGRELPIAAAIVGEHMELGTREQIKLRGPEPLRLERVTLETDGDADA